MVFRPDGDAKQRSGSLMAKRLLTESKQATSESATPSEHAATSRGNFVARLSKRALIGALAFLLFLYLPYRGFLHWTRISPPPEAGLGVPRPAVQMQGLREYAGRSWSSHERGLWEYHLEGDPFSLGYTHSRLGTRSLMDTERYMFDEMHRYVPSQLALFMIRLGVLLKYRNLPTLIDPILRLELAGVAEGQPDLFGDFLPMYHRVVFYHALHDITQTLENSPMLGCTALAAAGKASRDGHVYVGRNFDFEGPPMFDKEKAILFFKPQGKLPFASVAWPGMIGVVTGINTAGIFVSVNALRSEDKSPGGVPVELLLREVLEQARSLDEAIDLLKRRPVLVPDLYLIADGHSGETAVVERSPTRAEVRRSRDILAVANHALTPAFASDKESQRLRDYLTSGARQARADELLQNQSGKVDASIMLQLLRDKRGVGDKPLSLGNRNALDALIATHSVVVDATEMIIWVGVGPHALGRYVGFDLRRELLDEPRPQPADLAEDPTLYSQEYQAYLQAGRAMEAAKAMRSAGRLDLALTEAARAVALMPTSPELRFEYAELLHLHKTPQSLALMREQLTTFLTLSPPHRKDIEYAQALLTAP